MQSRTLSITDMYMSVLTSLSIDDKLDLISKLTASIRKKDAPKDIAVENADPFACFKGDWNDIDITNRSHTFTRNVETW